MDKREAIGFSYRLFSSHPRKKRLCSTPFQPGTRIQSIFSSAVALPAGGSSPPTTFSWFLVASATWPGCLHIPEWSSTETGKELRFHTACLPHFCQPPHPSTVLSVPPQSQSMLETPDPGTHRGPPRSRNPHRVALSWRGLCRA